MQVEAHFENIQQVLIQELKQAKNDIFVAVAWFTDRKLLDCLIEQAQKQTKVSLLYLDDDINRDRLPFSLLDSHVTANVYPYPFTKGKQLMHHKFCVIDHQTVITGSYNWSNKAQTNEENITITKDGALIANQFIKRFRGIVERYCNVKIEENDNSIIDISKLNKRLQIIRTFILLEEIEDLQNQVKKLEPFQNYPQIKNIISSISLREYSKAISYIESLIQQFNQISVYEDSEIFVLRLETKTLELEFTAINNQKLELEKLIYDFGVMHNKYLGALVKEILKIKRENLRKKKDKGEFNKKAFEEANENYEQYHRNFESSKNQTLYKLTATQRKELKLNFRKASLLCHPDRVNNAQKKHSELIFIELKDAYTKNDIARVNEILGNLEKNTPFVSRSEEYNEKAELKAEVIRIRLRIQEVYKEILEVKSTEVYQIIEKNNDWEEYFIDAQNSLKRELETV